jgi:hypothetical protein
MMLVALVSVALFWGWLRSHKKQNHHDLCNTHHKCCTLMRTSNCIYIEELQVICFDFSF